MTDEITEATLRQEWRTPPAFIEAVRAEFVIDLDVAASAVNAIVPPHYDVAMNGLKQDWFGQVLARLVTNEVDLRTKFYSRTVWCNPGFRDLASWIAKAAEEVRRVPNSTAVLMALAGPSTNWWECALAAGAEVRLLAPRVQFVPPPGVKRSSNAHENALLIFRTPPKSGQRPPHIWTWRWRCNYGDLG